MKHIALLGDSIFDNAAYVRGGPDVIKQLQVKMPEGWKATLKAVDGSMVHDVQRQLAKLPEPISKAARRCYSLDSQRGRE